jgi:excisionase family DNA binding protein
MEPMLTIEEAAQILRVTRVTISRWIRDGKIQSAKVGRRRLIKASEIERVTQTRGQA